MRNTSSITEKAYFGAGCFWHVEEVFRRIEGVVETAVGFMGGNVENPSYEQVCGGDTGHAETTKVVYDPDVISYEDLLDIFWDAHDPTQLNKQGPDVGEQYRSVIFYTDDAQKRAAEESKEARAGEFDDTVVTAIEPADDFHKAEEYHQEYVRKQRKEL